MEPSITEIFTGTKVNLTFAQLKQWAKAAKAKGYKIGYHGSQRVFRAPGVNRAFIVSL